MMSDHEEDLDYFPTFSAENMNTPAEPMVEHIAQNQQINGQLQVESLRKFHNFLMGPLLGSSTRS